MEGRNRILVCPEAVRHRYRQLHAASPSLRELEEQGRRLLRPFPALLGDLFCFFYWPSVSLAAEERLRGDKFNWLVLRYLLESPAYIKIREQTRLDEWLALAATEEFARRLLEHLDAAGRPAEGSPAETPARSSAVVKIVGIKFMERARASSTAELSDMAILAIAKEIQETLDAHRTLVDLCHGWGLERGQLHRLDHAERIALAQRFKKSRRLKELAAIVGRFRRLAISKQQPMISRVPEEVMDVTFGNDPARILPAERVFLAHPILRYDFYRRFAESRLAMYDTSGPESPGEGPIIICIDTSGSMAGEREVVAKAIAIGLLEIARLKHRQFVGIVFGGPGEIASFRFAGDTVTLGPDTSEETTAFFEGLIRFASHFFGGGTDYETPLREAMRWIEADRYPDGDLVFITDDYCRVTDRFLAEYSALKRLKRFSTFGVIVGTDSTAARTLRKLSDDLISSLEMTEQVADWVFERP